MDEQPNETRSTSPEVQKVRKYSTTAALALELPFTIVGAVVLGGVLGYFLDRWLHTKFIFALILGGVGFVAGLREVIRRLS